MTSRSPWPGLADHTPATTVITRLDIHFCNSVVVGLPFEKYLTASQNLKQQYVGRAN